ncbi:HAMP domain-containing protein [Flexibacter flexilis DSM 6793]|uniref:HAMP domain-containing protein n=1 Tax=Flexibacter flexilis DSM 6793 TaxID=927664 RepID=A0A1I1FQA9_9BACT|nr:GAF domain-containing protein [Flexibacter flexilis]SFC01192.1 HAMP domain-containing protein [Flexibacter flexilis DSM 6793]
MAKVKHRSRKDGQPSVKKGISYYMQINNRTIQGKLTMGCLSMSVLAFIMLVTNNWLWSNSIGVNEPLMASIPPAHQYLGRISDGAARAASMMQTFALTSDISYQNKSIEIIKQQIKPSADSLAALSAKWESDKVASQLENYQRSLNVFIGILQTTNTDQTAKVKQVASHLDILAEQASQLRQQLVQYQQSAFKSIEKQKNNLVVTIIIMFLIAFVFALFIGIYIVETVIARIRFLKYELRNLALGNLPDEIPPARDELNSLIYEFNILTTNLKEIKHFAEEVGKGNFQSDIKVFNNEGDLGSSLAQMRESLSQVAQADQVRNWSNEGYALFAEILRNNSDNIETLCNEVTRRLVNYLNVVQGSMFVLGENNYGEQVLELQAYYAYDKKKFIDKTIGIGQGLVGQAFLEGEVVYMTKVPNDYVQVTSGLGEANPSSIVLIPIKLNDQINGVIELASFKKFEPYQIEFLKKVMESIAATLTSVKTAEHTQKLLRESQELAEQMRMQEEEMRQQMEELQATQEEMERRRLY